MAHLFWNQEALIFKKSTLHPNPSEYSGPVQNSLKKKKPNYSFFQHDPSVYESMQLAIACTQLCIHPRDLPNAVLFPKNDPGTYLGFYLFV